MNTPVKVAGHPLRPMLILFALGLLGAAAIFDILSLFIANPALSIAAYWMIAAGIVGGLLAAAARGARKRAECAGAAHVVDRPCSVPGDRLARW